MLLGLPDHDPVDVPKGANAILVTHDLTPSLTVQLDREAIAAIATDAGTRTAHVAILARSLGIPAVVGLRDATTRLRGGENAVLDGSSGTARRQSEPTPKSQSIRHRADARGARRGRAATALAAPSAVTTDGVRIMLRANVDLPEEAEHAATSGAEGVGLMRTEFLVVGRADHARRGRAIPRLQHASSRRSTGSRSSSAPSTSAATSCRSAGSRTEANPFLGWRAIRMCLDEPELFKVQLRALLRAAIARRRADHAAARRHGRRGARHARG